MDYKPNSNILYSISAQSTQTDGICPPWAASPCVHPAQSPCATRDAMSRAEGASSWSSFPLHDVTHCISALPHSPRKCARCLSQSDAQPFLFLFHTHDTCTPSSLFLKLNIMYSAIGAESRLKKLK
jgi:hypothetical protein